MILGLEGVHTWTGPEFGETLVLNDKLGEFPHYRVTSVSGLYGTSDFMPQPEPSTQRLGEVPREWERDGKTVTYEGQIEATDLVMLREAIAAFHAAFYGTGEGRMLVEPHDDVEVEDLVSRRFDARCLDASVEERQAVSPHRVTHGYERAFSLALRLSEPRYFHLTKTSESSEDLVELGGTKPPLTPGQQVSPPSSQGLQVVTNNEGTAPTDGIITIEGPMRNPVVTNASTGHFLRFRDLILESGERLQIDFNRRTVKRPGVGVNVRHKLTPGSTWWDRGVSMLKPGNNTIRVRAYTIAAGSSLEVEYYPADY